MLNLKMPCQTWRDKLSCLTVKQKVVIVESKLIVAIKEQPVTKLDNVAENSSAHQVLVTCSLLLQLMSHRTEKGYYNPMNAR